jgi:hypothetical protein
MLYGLWHMNTNCLKCEEKEEETPGGLYEDRLFS